MFGYSYHKGDYAERAIYIFGSSASNSIHKFSIGAIANTGVTLIGGNGKGSASPLNYNIYLFGGGYTNGLGSYFETVQKFTGSVVSNETAALSAILSYTDSCSNGTNIYLFGGEGSGETRYSWVKMFNGGTSFSSANNLPNTLSRSTSNSIGSDAYVFGGYTYNTIHKYTGATRYAVGTTLTGDCWSGSSAKLGRNAIYIFGVEGSNNVNQFNGTSISATASGFSMGLSKASSFSSSIYVFGGGGSTAIRKFDGAAFETSSQELPAINAMATSGTKFD